MDTDPKKSCDPKSEYWRHHINQCHQSGVSQRHYCQANSLALSTFGYWKRKISKQPEEKIQFYPLVLPDKPDLSDHSGLTLHLQKKRFCIELAEGFSGAALSRLITTLEQL